MNLPVTLAMLGWPEIIGIIVVVLVLFGAKKVPELMRGLGHGIKEFKKATREVQEDLQRAIEEEPPPPPRTRVPEQSIAQVDEPNDHHDDPDHPAEDRPAVTPAPTAPETHKPPHA